MLPTTQPLICGNVAGVDSNLWLQFRYMHRCVFGITFIKLFGQPCPNRSSSNYRHYFARINPSFSFWPRPPSITPWPCLLTGLKLDCSDRSFLARPWIAFVDALLYPFHVFIFHLLLHFFFLFFPLMFCFGLVRWASFSWLLRQRTVQHNVPCAYLRSSPFFCVLSPSSGSSCASCTWRCADHCV